MNPQQEQAQRAMADISETLKRLFFLHRGNRNAYEEAVAQVVRKKAPGATRKERRHFIGFALDLYDEAIRNGA